MLKLSKLADYGVVILATLARNPEQQLTAVRLAEITTLPAPTVSKLLKRYAKVGLLHAQRGATGGYRLGRTPQLITVDQIIEAIDGPIAIAGCAVPNAESCGHEHACAIYGRWQPINEALKQSFSRITLAHLIDSENKAIETRFSVPHAPGLSAAG